MRGQKERKKKGIILNSIPRQTIRQRWDFFSLPSSPKFHVSWSADFIPTQCHFSVEDDPLWHWKGIYLFVILSSSLSSFHKSTSAVTVALPISDVASLTCQNHADTLKMNSRWSLFPTPGWLGVGFNLSGHHVFLLILSRRRERFLVIVPCHSCDQELLTGDKLGKSWLTPCGDSDPIVAPIVSLEKSKKLGWLGLDFLWINWAQEMTYFFNIPWGKQVVTSEKSVS